MNRKATGEKENSSANAAKDKTPHKKSNRKEKEAAKARAAREAVIQYNKSFNPVRSHVKSKSDYCIMADIAWLRFCDCIIQLCGF